MRANVFDAGDDFQSSRGSGILEVTAIDDVGAVGKPAGWTYESKTGTHMRGGTEGNVASRLCDGQAVLGDFVGGVLCIKENVGKVEIASDDSIAFFDGRTVQEKRRDPFRRVRRPKLNERTRETIITHCIAPGFLPSQFERTPAIEIRNWERKEALHQIRVKHRGECGRKKILAEDVVRFVFEFE